MTTTSDIERDTKANFAVAVVDDDPYPAVATSAYGTARSPVAVATGRTPLELGTVVVIEEKRQTELCCGSCCDYIQACIVVDIIFIVSAVISIIFTSTGISILSIANIGDDDAFMGGLYDDDLFDDVYITQTTEDAQETLNWWKTHFAILLARFVACLLFAILGIVGASKFNKGLVLAAGVWYCIDFVISIIYFDVGGAIMRAFFAYPHIGLFVALKRGSITPETYAREKYCCCGSGPR